VITLIFAGRQGRCRMTVSRHGRLMDGAAGDGVRTLDPYLGKEAVHTASCRGIQRKGTVEEEREALCPTESSDVGAIPADSNSRALVVIPTS
jgi:hypothetical protein